MSKEIIVHGKSKPGWIKRIGMHFSSCIDTLLLRYEIFASDEKNIPYKLAGFINSAKGNVFILSDFLDSDLFTHRAVLEALGKAKMRKVDIRIVVGHDYDAASVDIIDGSLGGVLINVSKGETPVKRPFIVVDGKHIWIINSEWNYMVCKMNDRRFARQLEAKFEQIYTLTRPLLLEPLQFSSQKTSVPNKL